MKIFFANFFFAFLFSIIPSTQCDSWEIVKSKRYSNYYEHRVLCKACDKYVYITEYADGRNKRFKSGGYWDYSTFHSMSNAATDACCSECD